MDVNNCRIAGNKCRIVARSWLRCARSTPRSGLARQPCPATRSPSSSSGSLTPSHPGCTSRPRWRSRPSPRPGRPLRAWFCSSRLTSGVWSSSPTTGHARRRTCRAMLAAQRCSHGTASSARCDWKVRRNGSPERSRTRISQPAPGGHSSGPGRLHSQMKCRIENTWIARTKRPSCVGQNRQTFLAPSIGEGFESSRRRLNSGKDGHPECTIAFTTLGSEQPGRFAG
jgi:hypothetical protein